MSGYEVLTIGGPRYVVVTDPLGAERDGEPVPITTRLLFSGGQVYGWENLRRKFSDGGWCAFMAEVQESPSGAFGRFWWERE